MIRYALLVSLAGAEDDPWPVYPDKVTYASSTPSLAEAFVMKYFGFSRRALNFEKGKPCAEVKWLNLCQSPEAASYLTEDILDNGPKYSWEFGVHFVNTPAHAQGPMSLKVWKGYLHSQIKAMDEWNPMMQAHSAYMARDLTPFVHSLLRDKVPHFLTYRSEGSEVKSNHLNMQFSA